MPIPSQSQIIPKIVEYLGHKPGGEAKTSEIHDYLAKEFSLTQAELDEKNKAGGKRFDKQIDGAIQPLRKKGQIVQAQRGVWRLAARVAEPAGDQVKAIHPAREHDELIEILERIGISLGWVVRREQGAVYRHDLSFSRNQYQSPRVVIEICDKGNVDKDIASLNWAVKNLQCGAILATVDERDYHKATAAVGDNQDIVVVKAQAIHQLSSLVSQIALLRMLFRN